MNAVAWLGLSKQVLAWLAAGSLAMLAASALFLPVVILRLPADHFLRDSPPPAKTQVQAMGRLAGNICGGLVALAGIAMLALPGQGLLAILVGLSWMTFPRKVAIERWIVTRAHLMRPLNWIRHKGHRVPLQSPGAAEKLGAQDPRALFADETDDPPPRSPSS